MIIQVLDNDIERKIGLGTEGWSFKLRQKWGWRHHDSKANLRGFWFGEKYTQEEYKSANGAEFVNEYRDDLGAYEIYTWAFTFSRRRNDDDNNDKGG